MKNMGKSTWNMGHWRRSGRQCRSSGGRQVANLMLFGLVFLATLDVGRPAHAYLDPGTGSLMLQMLLGGVAGLIMVGKLYWHRIITLFRRNPEKPETGPESSPK